MTAKDVLKVNLKFSQNLMGMLLGDLTDADLQTRPVPQANNIAWQIGHLIASEPMMASVAPGVKYPDLPATLKDQATPNKEGNPTPAGGYLTKDEYLHWFNRTREATIAGLDALPEADLDKPNTGRMAPLAPTVAALFLLCHSHTMMHAGQFSVVRRALGKPVLF